MDCICIVASFETPPLRGAPQDEVKPLWQKEKLHAEEAAAAAVSKHATMSSQDSFTNAVARGVADG